MFKHLVCGITILAFCGCSKTQTDPVVVVVDNNGEMIANGFDLKKSDLPTFVKELNGRKVVFKPFAAGVTNFNKAMDAKRDLEAAGATSVDAIGS